MKKKTFVVGVFLSIAMLATGCSTDIVSERNFDSQSNTDGDSKEDSGTQIPSNPVIPVLKTSFVGSCYRVDDRRPDDDDYCVDLVAERDLDAKEVKEAQKVAESLCEDEWDGELVKDECVDINNSMNDFKPIVDSNMTDRLCNDERVLGGLKVIAMHILAERGRLEFDDDDMECEKKRE